MDRIAKFLGMLSKKQRDALLCIFNDIRFLKLDAYDVKPLKSYKGIFRLRKGNLRIVFAKKEGIGLIIDIAHRKDIYKNL